MPRFARLALVSSLTSLVLGAGACGRSDLFSERHHGGGGISVDGGGGSGGGTGGNPEGIAGSIGTGSAGRGGTGGSVTGMGGRGGTGGGTAGRGGTGGSVGGRGGTGGSVAGMGGRGGTGGSVAGMGGRGGTGGTAGRGGTGGSMGGRGGDTCVSRAEICNNGVDDNCNNLADCQDPGCFGDSHCVPPGMEICNNNLDDDGDGKIDCADPDCMGSLACKPNMGMEICDNGVDDNRDNLVDCADPQCTTFPGCIAAACTADVDFGTLAPHGASVSIEINTIGGNASYATCAPAGGLGRVGRFQLDATADVKLDFKQGANSAHVIALFRAGASQRCDRNAVGCVDAMDNPLASRTFPALAPGVYWVIVDSYPGLAGQTTVTLSTGALGTPEICANGKDDDGNGLVDCQDAACKNHPSCVGKECVPDLDIGTLVVNGATRTVPPQNLRTASDTYQSTCAAGMPGGDVAIGFTLAEAAGLEVQFQQPQTARSIFTLYRLPAPGLACDADQLTCAFENESANAVAFLDLAAGRYVFIVKAQSPSQAGTINLSFAAFSGRRVEICGNGIDDDNDGLTDCADPDCFGMAGCPAPACTPDQDLGSFSWGTRRTVSVDTRNGGTLYPTSCSRGNGRERVLRLTLTQPMSLGNDCTDGGSHVIALARQVQPLDSCDQNEIVCVDPAVLPFGCSYSLPDLQPGPYNVIVQAFQSGSEGVVNLTLTGIQVTIREICDNGIDDDGDGFTDCADLKCVTEAICAKFACRADQSAGLLPLDGTPTSLVVQTAMAGDDQPRTACVSAPGGQDGVLDFQLPALADVTMQWAQVGNHDFALYDDQGSLLACDAGMQRACVSSAGMPTGLHTFLALPGGRYHLVVDADAPGKEGGVVLQLSAVATPMP
jgi:hypothetical protein